MRMEWRNSVLAQSCDSLDPIWVCQGCAKDMVVLRNYTDIVEHGWEVISRVEDFIFLARDGHGTKSIIHFYEDTAGEDKVEIYMESSFNDEELCMLADDPEYFLEWFSRHIGNAVPDWYDDVSVFFEK